MVDVERYDAETRRIEALTNFINSPLYAHGGAEGVDSDLLSVDNLAREACLRQIKHLVSKDAQQKA